MSDRPTTASSFPASSTSPDPKPAREKVSLDARETRLIIAEGLDLGFVGFAEIVLRLTRKRGDTKLLPSPAERIAVARPGSRLVTRHIDIDGSAAADVIDGAQVAMGIGRWGLRAATGAEALDLEPLDREELDQ